jgi:poly(A) polymerase/tRNA nucleotidyltransferase (CCA-adding enzyme)
MIRTAAPERVRDEWMKMLLLPKPSKGFYSLVRTRLLPHILPELSEGYRKKQNHYHQYTIFRHVMETVDHIEPEPILRLAALLHDIGKPGTRKKIRGEWHFYGHEKESERLTKEILTRYRFSSHIIGRVTRLVANHMLDYRPEWRDAAVRRLMRRVGEENMDDLLALWKADRIAHGRGEEGTALFDSLKERVFEQKAARAVLDRRRLAIDGHEVMTALGIPPGPEVGKALDYLLEKVLRHPERNQKKELTALLKKAHPF